MNSVNHLTLLSFCISLASFSHVAYGQENVQTQQGFTEEEKNHESIEHIEVRSSRYRQQLVTSDNVAVLPENATLITRTIADWLTTTPGVSYNGQGGQFQSYNIRGFSRHRIKSEVAGVPILTDRRAGNSLAFVPPMFIETLDIRKGPSASFYGSDAMGGVISSDLAHFDGLHLSSSYQLQNNGTALLVGGGNSQLSGALAYQNADDATAANGDKIHTRYENISGLVSGKSSLENGDLAVKVLVSQGNDIGKGSSQFPDERITIYPYDDHMIARVDYQHKTLGDFAFGVHQQDWQSDVIRVNSRQNITSYQSQTLHGLWQKSFDGLLGYSAQERFGGQWGVEITSRNNVEIDEAEYNANGELSYQTQVLDGDQDNIAFFVHQYGMLGAWQWGLSTRYDHIEQTRQGDSSARTSEDFLSFSASLHREFDQVTLHGELGNGFRFATLSERFFQGETPRGTTIGNPDLTAERSIGGQIGVEWPIVESVSLNLTAYQYQIDDYIERYEVSDDTLSYRNLAQADIHGLEFIGQWQQNAHVSHVLSYQYSQGEDKQGTELADISPNEWALQSMAYVGNWQLKNLVRFRQEKTSVGAGEKPLDNAFIWDLNLQYQMTSHWQLGVFISNITDELYAATADEDAPWQPERSIALQISYQP